MKPFVSFVQAKNNVDLDIVKYASAEKKSALEALLEMPATANDAATQAAALPKAYRQYVESSALLEGVKGATVIAEAIKNPKAEEAIAEPWTVVLGEGSEGALTVLDAQPWTDGDITIGVQGITEKEHNWMSFSDFRLAMFYPIEATVVDDISAALNNNNDKVVYNVNGQKVTKTGRGLYIIRSAGNQGRKVFVR